jgi:hypothetical protein
MERKNVWGLMVSWIFASCAQNGAEYAVVRSTLHETVELPVPEIGEAGLGAIELGSMEIESVEYVLSPRHRGYLLEGDVDSGDESGRSLSLRPRDDVRVGRMNVEGTGPWRSLRVYDVGRCSHVVPWNRIASKWAERVALRVLSQPPIVEGRREGVATISPRLALARTIDRTVNADDLMLELPIAADRFEVDAGLALGCDDLRATLVATVSPWSNGIDVLATSVRIHGATGCSTDETRTIVRELDRSITQFAASELYRLVVDEASRAAGGCDPISCTPVPVPVVRLHVRPEGVEVIVAERSEQELPPVAPAICDPLRMPEPDSDVPFPIFVP